MKKLLFFISAFIIAGSVMARADQPIAMDNLPQAAQQFMKAHFDNSHISYAEVDREFWGSSYEVKLRDGGKVEFDRDGQWREIHCKQGGGIPDSAVPAAIREFRNERFPGVDVIKIERNTNDYDVELRNGVELKFDRDMRFLRYDD